MKEMGSKYLVDKVFNELGLPPTWIVHASDGNRVDRETSARSYGALASNPVL